MTPSCQRYAGDDCKNVRCSKLLASQPGFRRAVREILEVVDQVGLVKIAMLQGKLRPVGGITQALQGGIGCPKAANAGKQLWADADFMPELQGQVLARYLQLFRQLVDAQPALSLLDQCYGVTRQATGSRR